MAFQNPGATTGDRIDLSAIDPNTAATGNQTFLFGKATGIGRLWLAEVGSNTVVRGNVNTSAAWEFELIIEDAAVRSPAYSAAGFIL